MIYQLSEFDPSEFFNSFTDSKHIVIAFSGGIDSSVMLNIMCKKRDKLKQSIEAIYIDHGLNDKSAEWGVFCSKECEKHQIAFKTIKIKEDCPKNSSIEAWARNIRYSLFVESMKKNDILLTAHHQDDQVETFFLQLLRGAGPQGLASMPIVKKIEHIFHIRPFLYFQRKEIIEYAHNHNISWLEDETNYDVKYQRNFIRHNVLPEISKVWPSYQQNILRTIKHQVEYKKILDEIAMIDIETVSTNNFNNLDVNLIKKLSVERQKNLIFFWLKKINLESPTSKHMDQIINTLINSDQEKSPCVNWNNTELRRYKTLLYASGLTNAYDSNFEINWDTASPLSIEGETLIAKETEGKGISKKSIKDAKIIIRYRHGGEKIYSNSLKQSKSIKQLFQEHNVLPWLRNKVPLIYINEKLAVVPGFCVDRNYLANKNETSLDIQWSGYKKVIQS